MQLIQLLVPVTFRKVDDGWQVDRFGFTPAGRRFEADLLAKVFTWMTCRQNLKGFGEAAFAAFQRGSNPSVDVVFLVDDHTFRSHSGFGDREGKLLVELAAPRTATLRQPCQVLLCETLNCPSGQRR